VVSEENYNRLMAKGKFQETFNDVITRVLSKKYEKPNSGVHRK
jgi:hypothetical protein